MKAIAIGFQNSTSDGLASHLPILAKCRGMDVAPVLSSVDPSYTVYIFSHNSPGYDVIGRIFRANPSSLVFQQLAEEGYNFIRISRDLDISDDMLQRASEKVMNVKSLSTKLRHNVRSPIQSIYDCAEKLLKSKALEDREELLSSLDLLHRSASRIYAAIESFSEFHNELDLLEEILLPHNLGEALEQNAE